MKYSHSSKLGSILLSTACVVAFGLLAGPVIRPASSDTGGIEVRQAEQAQDSSSRLRLAAGKSVIMQSSVRIVRASVANPDLARAVSIDEHELLLNGKTPGRTNITVWQEDGKQRSFDLKIDNDGVSVPSAQDTRRQERGQGLTGAYESAMARLQTVITGVDR